MNSQTNPRLYDQSDRMTNRMTYRRATRTQARVAVLPLELNRENESGNGNGNDKISTKQFRKLTVIAFFLMAAALLSLSSNSFATTVMEMDIDKISADAELIFEGEVILRETQQDNGNIIRTYITFRVDDVIKGNVSDTLELQFLGGAFNGRMTQVSGLQMPELGEKGIYFVESTSRSLVNPLLGWSQGHYLIEEDENGGNRVTSNSHRPITAINPSSNVPLAIRKPPSIVGGTSDTARGVMTETSAQEFERALSVEEFKQQIQELIE